MHLDAEGQADGEVRGGIRLGNMDREEEEIKVDLRDNYYNAPVVGGSARILDL